MLFFSFVALHKSLFSDCTDWYIMPVTDKLTVTILRHLLLVVWVHIAKFVGCKKSCQRPQVYIVSV